MKKMVSLLFVLVFIGCTQTNQPSAPERKDPRYGLREQLQDKLDISDIVVSPLSDNKGYLIDIKIKKDLTIGGDSEWNAIAIDVFNKCRKILDMNGLAKAHFIYYSSASNDIDWAHVWIDRQMLPGNWRDMTYHEFFSLTDPKPGSIQSTEWLCEYYRKYQSARPQGAIPVLCR